jgi:hypothetical protein
VRKKNKTIKFISKEEKEEKITIPLNWKGKRTKNTEAEALEPNTVWGS